MINFYPSLYCYLNIEQYDSKNGYWYARVGGTFEINIEDARHWGNEWAITARKSGEMVIIAQSRNWRDRTGEMVEETKTP